MYFKFLARARRKIERIRRHPIRSRGLTTEEADLAARAGLINWDQRWWWTEEWQRKEREVERDIRAGRVFRPLHLGRRAAQASWQEKDIPKGVV